MGYRFRNDSIGPTINVISWFLMVVNILAVFARVGAKFRLFHKVKSDDFIIIVSMLFSIVQCICVSMAVGSGYGNHSDKISGSESVIVMENLYAGYIVFIASLCLSKLSLSTFIGNLTLVSEHRRFARVVSISVILWTFIALIGAIFGAAFECGVSRMWALWNIRCYNLIAWRYFICISNVMTDALLVAQDLMIACPIQATLKKRVVVATVFLSRVLVTGAIIAELIFTIRAVNSVDPAYNFCLVTVLQGLVQCLSIVTASQGQLKPFVVWMEPRRHEVRDDTQDQPASSSSTSELPLLVAPRTAYII
ncbi:hypothetical protein N7456_011151 [Penicillium angulare]|uniref:Rhodopsin domain-containing protein n=1 Tax=Penicillium angulare TaxID=116970 RepID=A0A9W9ETG4_9EURO|nr:hypothetical protein N7456_011151 [Penicillium angulare]